jgi:hypothetical protein
MTIARQIGHDGSTHDIISMTAEECVAVDKCHEIIRKRFSEKGEPYDEAQRERCEWWLLGLLRYEGLEKMVKMAETAPFSGKKKIVTVGYAETKEVSHE